MSSRVLSAYFDDFRKGKRQREELRLFMAEAIRKDPLRRGHFMGWLDQAQYEHPIPVTEFLLLRKEIEASLDDEDQTRIVPPQGPVKTSPDAETLVAGNEEETLVAPNQDDDDATDISSGSQPSDMARLHAAATMIAPAQETSPEKESPEEALPQEENQDATVISTTHASIAATRPREVPSAPTPEPKRSKKAPLPTWLWVSATLLIVAIGLGYWASRPADNVIVVDSAPPAPDIPEPPPAPIPTTPAAQPETPSVPQPTAAAEPTEHTPAAPEVTPLSDDISPQQALELLRERVTADLLLPLDQAGTAQEVMNYMLDRYPGAPETLEGRQLLKDAYLAASKRAQGQGEWDRSQVLLDAAFNVLSATAR